MRKWVILFVLFLGNFAQAQTVVRDNFARANSGTLGANWTANSGATTTAAMGVTSNAAQAQTTGGNAAAFWSANSFSANQYSEIITSTNALGVDSHGGGPTVHASSGDNYYRFFCNLANLGNECQIIKVVAGVASAVAGSSGPINHTMAAGDQMRLEIIGTTLTAYINGTLVLTGTDSSLTTGSPGVAAYYTSSSHTGLVNGFEGGDIVPFAQGIRQDTFTRANSGTLGSNWTVLSDATDTQTLGITSNSARPQVTGGRAASFWNASNFQPDQYSQVIANGSATTTNTHLDIVAVRMSAGGNYYGFQWNLNASSNNVTLFKVVSGTFTALGSPTTLTPALGSLMRLEVIGTKLFAYMNGTLVLTATDAALSSGAPGISGFMTASSPTAFMTSWEGGSLVWKRSGTAIPIGSNGGTEEPSVLYESGAQILSPNPDGNIFKLWETDGWSAGTLNIYYWESNDGVNFTTYGSNPVITGTSIAHGFVGHFGSTYYAFYIPDIASNSQFDLWQSSNGVTGWSKTNTAVLSVGGVGTWDHAGIFNPYVWQEGSTYYMLYTARSATNYSVGLASSPDLVTWTKDPGNPVIPDGGSNGASPANGKNVVLNGGLYYMWGFGAPSSNLPTDHKLFTSPDRTTWTAYANNPVYQRVLPNEGVNLSVGQVADPRMVEVGGSTFMYYDATDAQSSGHIHNNVAIAPYSINQIMGMVAGTWIIAGNTTQPSVTVTWSGTASGSVTSDSSGNYVIPITTAGSYTIAPSKTGYSFSPISSSQTITTADILGVNFNAAATSSQFSPFWAGR